MYKLGKILGVILFVLFALTIYWSCISYLQLDINPLNWNGFFRFFTVITIGSAITGTVSFIIAIITDEL